MSKLVALLFALLMTTGCVEAFGNKNPYEPGDALGTFHLTANQTQNQCGDGALGAPAVWEFDVKLSWDDDNLFWNSGGQVIVGTVSPDRKSFSIETDVVQDMRTDADAGSPPCSVARHDTASGLFASEGEAVTSVSGTLSYSFSPTSGSSCSDLVTGNEITGAPPLFNALPCVISYSFDAPRTGD